MKTLRFSTQYKKDFKRYRNNTSKLEKLLEVFRMLENEIELPAKYRAHMLKGDLSWLHGVPHRGGFYSDMAGR